MKKPWTVGDLRKALEDVDDDVQLVFMQHFTSSGEDLAVEEAWESQLIPWEHDCETEPEGHRPGRDCPTVTSFEVHAMPYAEFEDAG